MRGAEDIVSRNPTDELVRKDGSRITLQEIFERVKVIEPGIIHFHEVGHATPEALAVFGEQIHHMSSDFDRFVLIVDLTDSTYPDSDYREVLVEWMRAQRCFHQCFVPPEGTAQRVTLRFMVDRAGISMTYHSNLEEAIEHAREALKAAK